MVIIRRTAESCPGLSGNEAVHPTTEIRPVRAWIEAGARLRAGTNPTQNQELVHVDNGQLPILEKLVETCEMSIDRAPFD